MAKDSDSRDTVTIGVDIGDKYCQVCVIDSGSAILEESRIGTTPEALRRHFGPRDRSRIVIECGTHAQWIRHLLSECGHEVIVANPRQIPLIYRNHSKNDRIDAEHLARLGRCDVRLLAPITPRSKESEAGLRLLRARDCLVKTRTSLVNHIRGVCKSAGLRLAGCSARSFHKRPLPPELAAALQPLVQVLAQVTVEIRAYDRAIDQASNERHSPTRLLRQVGGVGLLTSFTYAMTIEDPRRFATSRKVGSYVGLRPCKSQSGASDPEMHITKAGDQMLRRLLVTSAQYILGPFGPDSDLRRFGLRIASTGKKKAKRRAVVAVARKLAVLLHRLWLTGEVYEPLRNSNKTRPPEVAPAEPTPAAVTPQPAS